MIQRLPPDVVNRIAAGEVVQRPSAALKELLENSLDAGATQINVTCGDGGLDLLEVADDGAGICVDDLPLLCERHATSKLRSFDDLAAVGTFGFRGEALASMSFVGRVSVVTRLRQAPPQRPPDPPPAQLHQPIHHQASSTSASAAINAAPASTSHPLQATDQALALDGSAAGAGAGAGTCRYDTSIAYHASFIDGVMQGPADEMTAEPGTTLRVHDMFRNAPLRRAAFGRTTEEYARVCDVVSKYALRFPHVGFTCKKVGVAKLDVNHRRGSTVVQAAKTKFSGPIAANLISFGEPWPAATTSSVSPSPSVVADVETPAAAGSASGVSPTSSEALPTGSVATDESPTPKQFRFSGLCSSLNHAGKRGAFVLFVNKRLVGSTAVQKAVDQAYAPHLVTGVKPVVLLSIDVLPHLVDVNVHPTKHEVLLQQEREIVANIFGAVSKALQQNDGGGRKVAAAASQAQQKTVNERLFGPSQTTPQTTAPPPHQQNPPTPSARQETGAASQTSYQRDVTMSLIDDEDAVPAGVSGVVSQPPHPSPGGGVLNDAAVSAPRPTAAPASKKGQPIALRPVSEGALSANPASFGNTTSSPAPAWHRTRSDAQRGSMDSFVVRVSKDEALEAQEAQCQDIIDKEVEKYGGFRRKSKREQTGHGHRTTEMEILEVEDSNPGPPPAQSASVDPNNKEGNESGPTPSALAKLLGGVGAAAAKGEKDFFAGSASEASSSSASSASSAASSSSSSESESGDSDDASSADGSVADHDDEKLLDDEDGALDRRDRPTSASAALSMGGLFAKLDASTRACDVSDSDDEDDCAPAAAGSLEAGQAVGHAPIEQAKTQHRDVEKQEMLADFRAAMAKQSASANPAAAVAADDDADNGAFARTGNQNEPPRPPLGDFATPNRFSAVSVTDARSNERQQQRTVSIVNPSQGQGTTIPLSELLGLQSPRSSAINGQGVSFDCTPQNRAIDGGSMSERKRTRDLEGDGDCATDDKNSGSTADGGDGQEELLESVHAIRGDILAHGHGKLKQMFSSLVLVGPVNARTFLAQSGTTLYLLNTSALAYHACFQSIFAQWSVLPRYVIENPPTLKELLLFSLVNDPGMAGQLRALRTATARPSSTHQHPQQQRGEENGDNTATAAAPPSRRSSNFESMLAQASSTTGKDMVLSRSTSSHLQTTHAPTTSAKNKRSEGAKSANKSRAKPRRSKSKYILDQCSGSDGSTSGGSENEDETRGGFIVPDGVADDEDAQAAEAEREARRMRRLAREEESKLLLGEQIGEDESDAGAPSCARAQPCGPAHGESTMRNGGVHIPGHIDAGAAHRAADSAVRTLVQWAPMLEEYFGIVLSVDPAQCTRPCSFTTPNRTPQQNEGNVNANDVDACLDPPGAAEPESMGNVMPDSVRLSELPAPLSTAWPLPFRSVPLFLWRLSSCVDFSSEEASFVDVAREIALLISSQCGAQRHDMAINAPATSITAANTSHAMKSDSQNPAFASEKSFKKGDAVSVGEREGSGVVAEASEAGGAKPRFREPYDDLRVPLSKLTEALRAPWFVPPRELATEQAVRTVVTVEALYKVFERC